MHEAIDCITFSLLSGEGNPGAAASVSPTVLAIQRDQAKASLGDCWRLDNSSPITGANQPEQREQYPGLVALT
jgi:hypothetical protein